MLDVVGGLAPALGELAGTAPTALLPGSVGNLLAPVKGSLPTLLQPVQNTVPELLAPVQNALPTLPAIGKIQPPLGAVTNPLPELPTPPAPSAPGAGPSDNPAGPRCTRRQPGSPGGSLRARLAAELARFSGDGKR